MSDVSISYEAILEDREKAVKIRCKKQSSVTVPTEGRRQRVIVKETWLPKSQIEIDKEDKEITLPKWLCNDKELDHFITAS